MAAGIFTAAFSPWVLLLLAAVISAGRKYGAAICRQALGLGRVLFISVFILWRPGGAVYNTLFII